MTSSKATNFLNLWTDGNLWTVGFFFSLFFFLKKILLEAGCYPVPNFRYFLKKQRIIFKLQKSNLPLFQIKQARHFNRTERNWGFSQEKINFNKMKNLKINDALTLVIDEDCGWVETKLQFSDLSILQQECDESQKFQDATYYRFGSDCIMITPNGNYWGDWDVETDLAKNL